MLPFLKGCATIGDNAWRFLWGVDEMSAILLKGGSNGRLTVVLPDSVEQVARMKTIPGRRWHPEEKCWSVPNAER